KEPLVQARLRRHLRQGQLAAPPRGPYSQPDLLGIGRGGGGRRAVGRHGGGDRAGEGCMMPLLRRAGSAARGFPRVEGWGNYLYFGQQVAYKATRITSQPLPRMTTMQTYSSQDKAVLRRRVDREIDERAPAAAAWSPAQKMALACRMLAAQGHWHGGLAGQITARGEQPGTIWTLPFGLGADEARASELILIDEDLNPLDGKSRPNPAYRFHAWVFRLRPEVQCIAHTHPPAVSALSMVGEPLVVAHMDATPFFGDCAYLPEWPGLPIGDDEGEIISGALGDKRAVLLANHGMLTAGKSIEEATVMAS